MYNRRTLIISSEDMEPTELDSMRKRIGVGEGSLGMRGTMGETSLRTKTLKFSS